MTGSNCQLCPCITFHVVASTLQPSQRITSSFLPGHDGQVFHEQPHDLGRRSLRREAGELPGKEGSPRMHTMRDEGCQAPPLPPSPQHPGVAGGFRCHSLPSCVHALSLHHAPLPCTHPSRVRRRQAGLPPIALHHPRAWLSHC